MEGHATESIGAVALTPAEFGGPAWVFGDVDPYDANRKGEELRMLLVGFFTGMTIALVFLTYIVIDAAHLLP